ncbi:MAG: lytic transglycosylase domain-containing protein [Endomicrobium sp.]|nr:lytic transglycosylase domain-containing protein [Endomicrobium sp.]
MNYNSTLKIEFNSLIYNQIIEYLSWKTLPNIFAVFHFFEPVFNAKLEYYGASTELKYLTLIESSINGRTTSSAGAAGYWQFMPETGRQYGLRKNEYVNDWYNVVASSDAAARYLRDSYKKLKDWNLALVSYNCGIGNVQKAIKKAGSKKFWQLYPHLPKETRDYIIRYYAMKYIDIFGDYHNFYSAQLTKSWNDVSIVFYDGESIIKRDNWYSFLNPHILTNYIPKGTPVFIIN